MTGGQKGNPGQRGTGAGGNTGGQYGGQQQQGHSMLKSSSMDSETFASRGKPTNVNMVKKLTDVKQITKTNNNTDLLLGPGGGAGMGFGWNKAAQPKPSESLTTTTTHLTSSASFSNPSSYGNASAAATAASHNKQGGDDCDRRSILTSSSSSSSSSSTSTNLTKQLFKQNSSEMTSRLSMDSQQQQRSNSNYNNKQQTSTTNRKIDGSSYSSLARSETSSQTSSRETSTSRPSRDNSRNRNSETTTSTTTANKSANPESTTSTFTVSMCLIPTRNFTSDEIDRKVTSTLDEFIQNKDIAEALKDCEEFKPADSSQYVEFIELFIQKVLERSEPTRNSIGTLFYNVIKEKKINLVHIIQAFKNILEMAEDMAIDIPKIATYLSQIIAPLFQEESTVEFLSDFCEPIKNKPICGELISEILHQASNRLGHSTVVEIFKTKSKLQLYEFLRGCENPPEFIKKNDLTWALGSNRERTQSASVSSESYEKKLFQILQPARLTNELIFDKIEAEFGEIDCQSKAFIRALVTAVCRSCLDANSKLDPHLFKNRSSILTKYINRKEEFELESLYAIQALDHRMQHQPGNIFTFFFNLIQLTIFNA